MPNTPKAPISHTREKIKVTKLRKKVGAIMKTVSEWLGAIQQDKDIQNLIITSEAMRSPYTPRPWGSGRKQVHTHAAVMADRLWKSVQGFHLKILLETRYGYRGSKQERGAIKDALCVYLSQSLENPKRLGI